MFGGENSVKAILIDPSMAEVGQDLFLDFLLKAEMLGFLTQVFPSISFSHSLFPLLNYKTHTELGFWENNQGRRLCRPVVVPPSWAGEARVVLLNLLLSLQADSPSNSFDEGWQMGAEEGEQQLRLTLSGAGPEFL